MTRLLTRLFFAVSFSLSVLASSASAMEGIEPIMPSLYQNQHTLSRIVSDFEKLKRNNEALHTSILKCFEDDMKKKGLPLEIQVEFKEVAWGASVGARTQFDEVINKMDAHLKLYREWVNRNDQPILVEKVVLLAEDDYLMFLAALNQQTYYYLQSYVLDISMSFERHASQLADTLSSRYWYEKVYYSVADDPIRERHQLSSDISLDFLVLGEFSKKGLDFLEPSLTAFLPTQESFISFSERINDLIAILDQMDPEDEKMITSLEEVRANAFNRLKYYDSVLKENDPKYFEIEYGKNPELQLQ